MNPANMSAAEASEAPLNLTVPAEPSATAPPFDSVAVGATFSTVIVTSRKSDAPALSVTRAGVERAVVGGVPGEFAGRGVDRRARREGQEAAAARHPFEGEPQPVVRQVLVGRRGHEGQ